MLGSYGLLGIFVYGERTAGPTHPQPAPPTSTQPASPAPPMLSSFLFFIEVPVLLCVGGEEKQPMYGPDHQEEALCQWFTRVGGGAWNHSSLPTSHNNRDELSSQKPLLLLIKALYIVCFVFFPVFTPSFDKISMLLLYCFSTGVHHHVHASIIPSGFVCFLFVFFVCFFPPQTFYVKQKSSYFCIFISCGKAECRLFVSPLKGFTLWVCSVSVHQVMRWEEVRWAAHHSSF